MLSREKKELRERKREERQKRKRERELVSEAIYSKK